tara:strand:+ start:651 stop:1244 length:594 start_codon:yes stop_codon:yes gene_type:complete
MPRSEQPRKKKYKSTKKRKTTRSKKPAKKGLSVVKKVILGGLLINVAINSGIEVLKYFRAKEQLSRGIYSGKLYKAWADYKTESSHRAYSILNLIPARFIVGSLEPIKEVTNVEKRYPNEDLLIDYFDIKKDGSAVGRAAVIACTNRKMAGEVVLRGDGLVYMGRGVGERTTEDYIEIRPKFEEKEPVKKQLDRSIL